MLNKEWKDAGTRVHFIPEYYSAHEFSEWLQAQGEKKEDIGIHAGIQTPHSNGAQSSIHP
jgi:hypothetical protein